MNHAIVVLDETGSMGGQEKRVISSMNEYAKGLPKGTHLSVFKFDSNHWTKFFSGKKGKWPGMKSGDYTPGAMTPLWDAIAKGIAFVRKKAEKGDKVMVMIDTDGMENASKEQTVESVKALIDKCKKKGWEFLFMSGGIDNSAAISVGRQARQVGVSNLSASFGNRRGATKLASSHTTAYFSGGSTGERYDRVVGDDGTTADIHPATKTTGGKDPEEVQNFWSQAS